MLIIGFGTLIVKVASAVALGVTREKGILALALSQVTEKKDAKPLQAVDVKYQQLAYIRTGARGWLTKQSMDGKNGGCATVDLGKRARRIGKSRLSERDQRSFLVEVLMIGARGMSMATRRRANAKNARRKHGKGMREKVS